MCGAFKTILPIALGVAGLAVGIPAIGASLGLSTAGGAIAGGALSLAGKAVSGLEQAKSADNAVSAQRDATATADRNAKNALTLQEQEIARANAKQPNPAALLLQNQNASGLGGTQLTPTGGVPTSSLQLGKNTLLGQ
jgi:hypothetical protein